MFASDKSKELAARIQAASRELRGTIRPAIWESVDGKDEVPFIKNLATKLPFAVDTGLRSAGIFATTNAKVMHQKPKVSFIHPHTLQTDSCELGDLLYVVKYRFTNALMEAKSVIWQVKSSKAPGDARCAIDPRQLALLHRWPVIEFGRDAGGRPQSFPIVPLTLDFGSYMLMMRRPTAAHFMGTYKRDYGVTLSAWRLAQTAGSRPVDAGAMPYTLMVSDGLVNQIAFMSGEPHSNPEVKRLIDALYRFCDWAPDPPDEFKGYFNDYDSRRDEGAFVIMETVIHADERVALPQLNREGH